jgi:F420H(2)-dependent quinone reductase
MVILCRQPGSSIATPSRAKLFHEEPEAGNLHIRNCDRNILANPDVEVQVGTKKVMARARTAEGEERLRLWKKALEFWPPYADYQLKTERQIPVVVLDPVR